MSCSAAHTEYVPLAEAAAVAGMPERTFRRLVARGVVPVYGSVKDGRRRFVRREDLSGLENLAPMQPLRRRRRSEGAATAA